MLDIDTGVPGNVTSADGASEVPSSTDYDSFSDLDNAPAAEATAADPDAVEAPEAEATEAEVPEETTPEAEALAKKVAEKAAATKPAKLAKIKAGDKTHDMPMDAQLSVPVDGKPVSVTLGDLMANYSGKVAYEQKFESLANDRKAFETDVQETDHAIGNLVKLVNDGKMHTAVQYLYEVLGGDPKAARDQFRTAVQKEAERIGKMSPEERRAAEAEEEAEYYRSRETQRKEVESRGKEHKAVEARVEAVLKETGMDKKAYADTYDEMKKLGAKPEQLTPEAVAAFRVGAQRQDGVNKILESCGVPAENISKAESELLKVWGDNPKFTEKDIQEIAREVYGKADARALSQRIRKDAKARPAGATASPKKTPSKREAITFDDLE